MRARIHPGRETFTERVLSDRPLEFGSIHPDLAGKPYRECFALSWTASRAATGGPPQLARYDVETGAVEAIDLGPDTFPAEPLLAPREGGGAWVLSLVYDGSVDRSYLAVLDSARWGEPPVAKLWFDHAIPLTFHGAWVGSEQAAPGA
jgi:all-trans-8'-apo-beta-carotenal 15,15'-oxygenase